MTLIGILPCLGAGDGQRLMFCILMEAYNGLLYAWFQQRCWLVSCIAMVQETGRDSCFVPGWRLKWLAGGMVSAEMLNCKLLSTQAAGIKHLYFKWCDRNHQWPAMAKLCSQNSVFLRGAECHFRVAEFLLHNYKRMIKRKFRSSNTLLSSAEYMYAITRKEHLSFLA